MASNGACDFQPSAPSPWRKRTLRMPSSFSSARARFCRPSMRSTEYMRPTIGASTAVW
jgi:hypothetical protein